MTLPYIVTLFTSDPVATAKTGLRFLHFIGLAMGLGGATVLDLVLLRFFLRGRIEADTFAIFKFSTGIVDIGLRLLWITGAGFLFHYALFDPEKLSNPKVHAKLVVVLILTLNGYFIHSVILPYLRSQTGKSIFQDVGAAKRTMFVMSGAISFVSWYSPVALGAFSQLNFTVPATTLLLIYLALIALAAIAMHALIYVSERIVPAQSGTSSGPAGKRPTLVPSDQLAFNPGPINGTHASTFRRRLIPKIERAAVDGQARREP